MRRRAGHAYRAALAALTAVALAGACSSPSRPAAPPRTAAASSAQQNAAAPTVEREDALAALLTRRAAAVRAHDRAAFAATLDSTTSGFGLRQLAQYDALVRLPLGTFTYGTPEPAPALGPDRVAQLGPDAWVARVAGRYGFAGYDTSTREFESYFTAVRRGSRWKLADDTDGGTQVQLWDLPRLTVLRSGTTLVVGSGPANRLRPYLGLGDLAVSRVRSVWSSGWNARLVLVVPATAAQMAEQVGQDARQVSQVAAVTDGPIATTGRAGADRVVVNPGAFATLEVKGRQVVVTHEATHVAVRATTDRPVPLWLSEGLADYVGYRDIGATRQQVAAALLDRVRAGAGPKALPGPADFDPGRSTIAPSYNAAWLAVCRIVDRRGEAGLVKYYRAVATTPRGTHSAGDPDANARAAFPAVLGTTEAAFTRDWVAYLRRLAGS
ncbi:hypothetical protein [Phycicoccus sp. Soil748]|uniref:hypothetical protein n=1 Tax=Intrasporangiaceae TaxID=85021 RepID=UPI000703AF86|nr:hypothetical protein [Phycicoccus sp. Soil748]KRE55523.1 hypothetical protein ASG70_09225 [Phycicoccus sp. Soil748]